MKEEKNNKFKLKIADINKIPSIVIILFIIIIILLGVFIRIEIAKEKKYYHMDEIYSQGLINYKSVQLSDNDNLYNTVHSKEYFKDYIEISEYEKLDFRPVIERQKEDVHPPLYYFFLKILTNFNLNNFSKWPGIILNLISYVISIIFIYLITYKLTNKKIISILPILIYTISSIAVDNAIFIRMYELASMFVLIYSYILIKILLNNNIKEEQKEVKEDQKVEDKKVEKDKKEERKNKKIKIDIKKEYVFLSIITLLGALTHYYFIVFVFGSYILSLIYLLKNKRKKDLITLTLIFVISGIIYLIIWPVQVNKVFNKINSPNLPFIRRVLMFLSNINSGYINLIIFVIIFSILEIINIILEKKNRIKGKNKNKKEEKGKIEERIIGINLNKNITLILFLSSLFYLTIIFITASFVSNRYIYPVLAIFSISIISLIVLDIEEILIYFNYINISEKKKKIIVFIITMILILIFVLPQSFNLKKEIKKGLSNQYLDKKDVIQKVEDLAEIPLIYVYDNKQYFDIIDDVYPLSKIDKSIIVPRLLYDENKVSYEEYILEIRDSINKILDNIEITEKENKKIKKDKLLVLINHWYNEDKIDTNNDIKNIQDKDTKIYPTQINILKDILKYLNYNNIEYITEFNSSYLFLLSK